MPADIPNLRAIMSYYSSTVTFNSEGDPHVLSESAEGLGEYPFLHSFHANQDFTLPQPRHQHAKAQTFQDDPYGFSPHEWTILPWDYDGFVRWSSPQDFDCSISPRSQIRRSYTLTQCGSTSGYFLAGGTAGVVSRTATAALDRLKVYLIAQVGRKDEAVKAAKEGSPLKAAHTATRPLINACKDLWKMGGMRSLFAGK